MTPLCILTRLTLFSAFCVNIYTYATTYTHLDFYVYTKSQFITQELIMHLWTTQMKKLTLHSN